MAQVHDFSVGAREWEKVVFANATEFKVNVFQGRGKYDRFEFSDFIEALNKAQQIEAAGVDRALIYAISPEGRYVCLDRKDYLDLLKIWAAK